MVQVAQKLFDLRAVVADGVGRSVPLGHQIDHVAVELPRPFGVSGGVSCGGHAAAILLAVSSRLRDWRRLRLVFRARAAPTARAARTAGIWPCPSCPSPAGRRSVGHGSASGAFQVVKWQCRIIGAAVENAPTLRAPLHQLAAVLRAGDAQLDQERLGVLAGRIVAAGDELAEPPELDDERVPAQLAHLARLLIAQVQLAHRLLGVLQSLLERVVEVAQHASPIAGRPPRSHPASPPSGR